MKEDFQLGEKLESVYPLLDMIFHYLDDRDLDNVMKVKKSWATIARRLLNRRTSPSWVTCYKNNGNIVLKSSSNLHASNASKTIILFGNNHRVNQYVTLHDEHKSIRRIRLVDHFSKDIVSRDIEFCVLSCPKVVSYFSADVKTKYGSWFDALSLPEIPGIKTCMFHCNFSKLNKNPALIEDHIKPFEEVKCLLLFDDNPIRSTIDSFFKIILEETKPEDIALGGGLIYHTNVYDKRKETPEIPHRKNETFCIAFTKRKGTEPDFSAASLVIKGSELSEEDLNEHLSKFRESIIMRKTSIAFRICCQAKKGKKKESIIFNTHFPDTPLLGLEAVGEIGWNSFNLPSVLEHSGSKPKKSKKSYPKFQHEWSTVFVVITWGKTVEK